MVGGCAETIVITIMITKIVMIIENVRIIKSAMIISLFCALVVDLLMKEVEPKP